MADNEVIKALECCSKDNVKDCDYCPYDDIETKTYCANELIKDSLDLINRQQADIERFRKILNADVVFVGRMQGKTQEANRLIRLRVAELKTEAIKEFAERLKNCLYNTPSLFTQQRYIVNSEVDTLVEEMTVNYGSTKNDKQRKEKEI